MASLNELAEKLAFLMGKEQDYYTLNSLKLSIRAWRASFIRKESDRGGVSDQFKQTLTVEMILTDLNGSLLPTGTKILRSKNKVPFSVRMYSDVDLLYVGTVGGGRSFFQVDWQEIQNYLCMKYMKKKFMYVLDNQYIFVPCNPNDAGWKLLNNIWVIGAFADPEAAISFFADGDCYNDNMEYPIALDMLPLIMEAILKGEFMIANTDDKEIGLNPGPDIKNNAVSTNNK